MDANTLLIVNKIQKNEPIEFRDLILYLIVIPIMTLILTKFSIVYTAVYDYLYLKCKQWSDFNEVIIEGYEAISFSYGVQYEYPPILTAFVWKISEKGYKVDLRAYDNKWMKNLPPTITSLMDFSLDTTRSKWIGIEDDISFRVDRSGSMMKNDSYFCKTVVSLVLRSRKNCLRKYLENVLNEYEAFMAQKTQGKLYHFLYTGMKEAQPTFVTKCFSDLVSDPNNETFDHLINEHSEQLIKDLKRLKDINYHIRTGTSRKKGYLFWGIPGTGKSRTVLAMANYDNRHILEIPISRIKTNEELEKLIGIEQINGVKFRPNQIIFLFEEIDTADVSHKRKESDSPGSTDLTEKEPKKATEPDKNAELELIIISNSV
jgi:ATPase family associated with various cellular activities (AAA)